MEDRELLELAAKAAGYKVAFEGQNAWMSFPRRGWWSPRTDDGDALRLAVKLGADVTQHPDRCSVTIIRPDREAPADYAHAVESHGSDPMAATRLAILRAAAEIGLSLLAPQAQGAR